MIEELGHELDAAGIRGRRRDRILAEVADHLACNPAADLGDPESLARQFANELAASGTRRAAFVSFGALMLTAAALLGTQAAIATYPDIASGRSLALAAIAAFCLFVCSQVAFVSGSLSALRALRLRREPEIRGAEIALLRRRTDAALASGAAATTGIALYALNFWNELPFWWAVLSMAVAGAVLLVLALAAAAHARARALSVSIEGEARGLAADIGLFARPGMIGIAVVLVVLLASWRAEGSFVEGAFRAAAEGVALFAGLLALGRPLGLRSR